MIDPFESGIEWVCPVLPVTVGNYAIITILEQDHLVTIIIHC